MRTIYLVRKMGRYSTAPTNIRAFEAMVDAEDLIGVLKRAGCDDVEVIPLELSSAIAAPQLELPSFQRFIGGTKNAGMPEVETALLAEGGEA